MGLPLRILHVVVNMNRGGAETLIMNIYRNIDRTKVQFDFLTCKDGVFDTEILDMGGKVHRIPYITDVGHFQYIKALNHFFLNYPEYRIVHAHMDKMSGFVLRAAKKAGVPIRISHSHSTKSEGGFAAKLYKGYAGKFVFHSASHIFACSATASKWLYGNRANKATILKNGIDCDKFIYSSESRKKVRDALKIGTDSFIIGHVGRFSHQKNHTLIVDIFAEVMKYKPNALLVLVGDGSLRPSIEKKVNNIGLKEHVKFLGVRSDIHDILQTFDVMLFPSIFEGLPVTLIEAQGVGLPCVISNTITDEVDMGANLIKYVDITSPPQIWANRVFEQNNRFSDTKEYIKNKGYDIKDSAGWLQTFYLDLVGGH